MRTEFRLHQETDCQVLEASAFNCKNETYYNACSEIKRILYYPIYVRISLQELVEGRDREGEEENN